ncbi:uncharacterized protein Pmm2 isoform X1 [Halyomorpha halys]|uniref:uncharacterized protein Pmm2 isoform X1 n=1 Tax=Halyomorpha halys TaxID=286706 RepID=UPI0006D4ECD2|nr:phosphomannomutase [Halyomorpha halys]
MVDKSTICLFDVDGTLTKPRKVIDKDLLEFLLQNLKKRCDIGIVGGSDLSKISEQLGGKEVLKEFNYVFAENGLVALKDGEIFATQSIQNYIGEKDIQKFINYCLRYMSEIELPLKRGTFIEFRSGLINVCPIGRSCSQAEREDFEIYDKKHKIRETFVKDLKEKFSEIPLEFTIGGQISFDVYPKGWDKRFCLQFLKDYKHIHFFGDKTSEGGNDYEIFRCDQTYGHSVTGPEDTFSQLNALFP